MSLNIEEFQHEVGIWSRYNFPNNQSYHPLLGVAEETGELMHAFLKAQQGIRGDQTEALHDAVGDLVVYLADFCERNDINLETAIETTWSIVRQRNWLLHPKNGVTE